MTLRRALEGSLNVPTIRLSQMVGLNNIIDAAHRIGIRQKLSAYPSMPLGAFEVTLAEMTAAYSVFADQGLLYAPFHFDRITDANGDVLEQTKPDAREVASPQASFQLLQMLKGVTQRGTAASAASLGLNIAGKTGTTNDYTDAWFIGMTPRYTIGVWVGNDMKTTLGQDMTGTRVALPIWIRILSKMKAAGRIDPKADFEAPPNVIFTAVDYETGLKGDALLTPTHPRGLRQRLPADGGMEPALGRDHPPAVVPAEGVRHAQKGESIDDICRRRRPATHSPPLTLAHSRDAPLMSSASPRDAPLASRAEPTPRCASPFVATVEGGLPRPNTRSTRRHGRTATSQWAVALGGPRVGLYFHARGVRGPLFGWLYTLAAGASAVVIGLAVSGVPALRRRSSRKSSPRCCFSASLPCRFP